jgi:hypothetical protein
VFILRRIFSTVGFALLIAAHGLLANQSLTVNITLEVGAVTETINVGGAAVQTDTSTSTLREVVDHARNWRFVRRTSG